MWKFDEADYIKRVLSPAVDAFKNSGRWPDYFERYDLPLDVSESKDIETAISTLHACWNKNKQNPRFNKLLSALLADKEQKAAKRDLLDEKARTALREHVKLERDKRLEARFASLDRSIKTIASKGYITPTQQQTLITQFCQQGLAEDEIRRRVHVPVREADVRIPVDEGLPKTVRDQIRNSLGVLHKRDLYEFLGVKQGCIKQELIESYHKREQEWRPKPSDNNKNAAQVLLGIIKTYMIDGDPVKYERAIIYSTIEELRPMVRLAASDKRKGVTKAEFEELLGLALSHGLSREIANEYILTLAEEYGASVEWTINEDTVRCAKCSAQVSLKKKPEGCNVCGAELWVDCPKCSNRVAASDSACVKCRFKTGDLPRVRLLVRQAELDLGEGLLEEALLKVREAELMWGRQGEVAGVVTKVENAIERVNCGRREIDKAMAKHQLFAARKESALLSHLAPTYKARDGWDLGQLKADIEQGLKRYALLAGKAREQETNGQINEAISTYQDALQIAVDGEDALEGLRRCPPESVTIVRAEARNGNVLVEWSPSSAVGGIEYLLVRREGNAAASPNSGEIVSRTESTSYLDEKVQAGSNVFYTVFVERSGVVSKGVSSKGVLVTREVSNLNLEAGDGVVRCSWEFAVPDARVRILREEGRAPTQLGDGIEITPTGPHNLIDRDVRNGYLYYYRVLVEYRGQRGQPIFTSGIVKSIKPEQTPSSISEFQISLEQGVLHVSWIPPKVGTVNFYRTIDKPEYRPGQQIPGAKLAALGVPLRSESNNLAVDFAPPASPAFYVPVTVAGDVAVVGNARRYVATQDVSRLKVQDFGKYLLLQWQWPEQCRLAFISWRHDIYPMDPTDTRAVLHRMSKGEYEHQGGFRVEKPDKKAYYFVVFAASQVEGEYIYGSGVSPGARALVRTSSPLSISYSIARTKWFSRNRLTITLNSEKNADNLPEILVIAKRGNIRPLRNNDGVVLATLSNISLVGKSEVSHHFTLDPVRRPCYLRAFFRDESSMDRFRLIDPPPQELRIS